MQEWNSILELLGWRLLFFAWCLYWDKYPPKEIILNINMINVENFTFEGWQPEPIFRSLLHWPKDGCGWDKLGVFVLPAVVSWKGFEINFWYKKDEFNNITFLLLAYAVLQSQRRCWIVLFFLTSSSAVFFWAVSGGLSFLTPSWVTNWHWKCEQAKTKINLPPCPLLGGNAPWLQCLVMLHNQTGLRCSWHHLLDYPCCLHP